MAPVAALFPRQARRVYCARVTQRYFGACGVDDALTWDGLSSPFQVLHETRPDVVLCGTTRYLSPDRTLVAAGKQSGIRSVVLLDEWHRYAERFQDDSGTPLYLPDTVCVPDDLARRESILAGIPGELVEVTGSPALASLCDGLERYAVDPPPLPRILGDGPRPWIVFLSETHADDYGEGAGKGGPFGTFLGYTERTVAADLAEIVARTSGCRAPSSRSSTQPPATARLVGTSSVRRGAGCATCHCTPCCGMRISSSG